MKISMFNWRILTIQSGLPANSKYLAIYLSTYMNEWGDNCYPSIQRISHETGLSKPTVIKHIKVLNTEGWLETRKKGFDGQAWAHNQYYPNIPEKAVKEINRVEQKMDEGGKTDTQRRLNRHEKAVKQLNTNSTVNSTDNTTGDYFIDY